MSDLFPSTTEDPESEAGVDVPVLIDVWHPRCASCRALQERLVQFRRRAEDKVRVKQLNALEAPEVVGDLGIESVPTLLIVRHGRLKARLHGARKIQRFVNQLEVEMA